MSDFGRVSAVANRKNDLDFEQSERFTTFFDPDGTRGRDKHSKPSSHEIPGEFPLSSALRWFDCKILLSLTPRLETIPLIRLEKDGLRKQYDLLARYDEIIRFESGGYSKMNTVASGMINEAFAE